MKTVSVLCVLLTITVTASSLQRDIRPQQISDRKTSKRVIKRDASLLLDTSPIDIDPVYKVHPVIAYRRLSRSRLNPRSKQSSRLHKSTKKFKKPVKPNRPRIYKKSVKPKYYRKIVVPKNKYSRPTKYPQNYVSYPEPVGFGEPPNDLISYSKNVRPKPAMPYRDELIDSYGEPIKPSNTDSYPPAMLPTQFSKELDSRPTFNSWQNIDNPNDEPTYAYSKKRPVYDFPTSYEVQDIETDFELNNHYSFNKPNYNMDQNKFLGNPWKVKGRRDKDEDEIIVGGQYAEPPARYVPKFQPSAPMFENDDDFRPSQRVVDPEVATSATISPYVNYKHSNLAFSPQNLNDAFSIVEK